MTLLDRIWMWYNRCCPKHYVFVPLGSSCPICYKINENNRAILEQLAYCKRVRKLEKIKARN